MKELTFGELIKKQRESKKISQHTLAENIKQKYNVRLSTSYISMIETNTRTNLTVNLINALLEYLNLPPEAAYSLFAGKKEYSRQEPVNQMNQSLLEKELTLAKSSPPEVKKVLNEIYNLLMMRYATK